MCVLELSSDYFIEMIEDAFHVPVDVDAIRVAISPSGWTEFYGYRRALDGPSVCPKDLPGGASCWIDSQNCVKEPMLNESKQTLPLDPEPLFRARVFESYLAYWDVDDGNVHIDTITPNGPSVALVGGVSDDRSLFSSFIEDLRDEEEGQLVANSLERMVDDWPLHEEFAT